MLKAIDYILGNMLLNEIKKTPRCKICKTRMTKSNTAYLFLLPLFHDQEYKPSPEYYIKNCIPINRPEEIPTGQRACRLWIVDCPKCSNRRVFVQDFLRVRDQEVIEHKRDYSYQELSSLLSKNEFFLREINKIDITLTDIQIH